MKTSLRVVNPPPRPLMIWDGECHFCRRWIERWREITGDQVNYETSQRVGDRFPEVLSEQFLRSVVLIAPDGAVFCGAEAVFRSLQCRASKKWMAWSYYHVPGFAPVSEAFYRFVSLNRRFASAMTRLLWGNDVRPPTYFAARRWFLRALGLIFLIAFVSLWVQIAGLIGSNGITPVSEFLSAARQQLDDRALSILPTLCWFNSSDAFLHFLCGSGAVFSVLLICGIAPAWSLVALVTFYLSLTIAGQTFLSFQWDILLVETGFLAILLAPWRLWWTRKNEPRISRAGIFLLKLLLFKLILMSGAVKLTSGDDCWWDLRALDYHYWSQPLPNVIAWWADQHPEWFKEFSVAFCLVVELIVPFLIWSPRRLRLLACSLLIFLQLAIAATGNYNFFNLLTIALCMLLIDDAVFRRKSPPVTDHCCKFVDRLSICVATIEIIIEGSADGIDWQSYEFKWKPGGVKRAPGWCAPHQLRLDWQMWFAALGSYRQNPWFVQTVIALLHGKPRVAALFEENPFPESPPRYIRATLYRYRFTSAEEHRQTGAWWKRQALGEYLPSVSLEDVQ